MDKSIFIFIILFSYSVFSDNKDDIVDNIIDPTKPYYLPIQQNKSKTNLVEKKLKLTAVFFKRGKQQVIVNRDIYQLGDLVNNKKITAITFNSITLKENGKSVTLHLITPFKKVNSIK